MNHFDAFSRNIRESAGTPYGLRTRVFLWLADRCNRLAERCESLASWLNWKA